MDLIMLRGCTLSVRIGVTPEERARPQRVEVDLFAETDLSSAIRADDLACGVSYSLLRKTVRAVAESREFALLETLGHEVLLRIFEEPRIVSGLVVLKKPDLWPDAVPGVMLFRRKG